MSRLDRPALERIAKGPWLGLLAAFGLLLLSRPFRGVHHDGRLYVADALAKLDPNGVGRDLMFVHDGQFGFSLYTPMLARLIHWLGLTGGTMAIVAVTLVLWFLAAAWLIERLLAEWPPAVRWAALVFVVVLPDAYGPMNVIGFCEPYATPRGLAEAAGLAGMAAYLSGRRFAGLAICAAGMLFHPIMGLCSAAVIAFAMCLEDRRWLWAGLGGLAVVAIAGWAHLPLASRIFTVMDPAWRAVVETRSPILFPSLWPIEAWGRLTVQACTVAAAAFLLRGPARRLTLGALIAGGVGLVVVVLLADRLSLLLFLQVQTWRMLQPLAVLAAASLALLSVALPKRGPSGLLGLALLGVAWMFRDIGVIGLLAASAGLACVLVGDAMRFDSPRLVSGLAVGLLVLTAAVYGTLRAVMLIPVLQRAPNFDLALVWANDVPGLLMALGVGVWLVRGWSPPPIAARVATAAVIVVLAALLWDGRPAFVRYRDQGREPDLIALTAARPGPVLWLVGDVEPWELMGRASWASKVQSAGVVFSRPLALELSARAERLSGVGLIGPDWMRPLTSGALRPSPPKTAQVQAFCAASDAPAWIVWPLWDDAPLLDPALKARSWTPATPFKAELVERGEKRWLTASRYAVIPCAGA